MQIHVYHHHVDLILYAKQLDKIHHVLACQTTLEAPRIVAQNALSTRNVQATGPVCEKSAEIHAQEPVAIKRSVLSSITFLCAHVFRVILVIHSQLAAPSQKIVSFLYSLM
jgi:hypothetical protein